MKQSNEYAQQFGRLYAETSKAVFAAIVYSYVSAGGDASKETALENFLNEWRILHDNGIVPQPPPAKQT